MDDLRIEKETPGEIIYVSHFEGQPVHFMKDKRTGEITVNADDVVRAIGAVSYTHLTLPTIA